MAVLAIVLTLLAAVPVSANVSSFAWHRLNPDQSNPAPEHERLRCVQNPSAWLCGYDKVRDPARNLAFDPTIGIFRGTEMTDGWECAELLGDVCGHEVTVVAGTMLFVPPGEPPFVVAQELIITDGQGVAPLYVHWTGQFACPWYGSFSDALEANPFPLPFDGVNWPSGDCLVG